MGTGEGNRRVLETLPQEVEGQKRACVCLGAWVGVGGWGKEIW